MILKIMQIAFVDMQNGLDPSRILKKSWARYKKHGFKGMYVRLENEYRFVNPKYIPKYHIISNDIETDNYKTWIENSEQNIKYSTLIYEPLFSIIMPVYNTDTLFLDEAIKSVLNQNYTNWELCIADDASTDDEVLKVLKKYETNPKVKIRYKTKNEHISKTSNEALKLAVGEYVVFLDHDDRLAPFALSEVAQTIAKNKSTKLIYSDEDKIDQKGNRFAPYFKSDWNPDLFFSQNYINHLTVIKKEIIDKIGGFKVGVEGSQDYDLILRSLKYIKDDEIVHIPKILYHWRAIEGSSAYSAFEKGYTTKAGIKALKDYFQDKAKVTQGLLPNTYKIEYPLDKKPFISIIIPTKDMVDILKKCIASIFEKTNYEDYEIIIINNNSVKKETFDYFEVIKHNKKIKILDYNKPFNYSKINNFAVSKAKGNILVFMNNDIEIISQNWLCEMVRHNLRKEIGVVGTKLYYPNNTIQHAGVILGIGGVAGHSHKYFSKDDDGYFARLKIVQNYSAVTGALMSVRREIFDEIDGFEEKLIVAFNDIDFCLKVLSKGYRNLWTPYVEAIHYESISRGKEDNNEKIKRFAQEVEFMKNKWNDVLINDKYYNPNLTLQKEDFSIREDINE